MGPTICLLTCALAVAQPADRGDWVLTPQLARGQELVYSGSFVEEALSPNVQFQRSYRIDATVLVLDAKQDKFDLAILTVVSTKAAKSPQASGAGAGTPASVRLETLTLDNVVFVLTHPDLATFSPLRFFIVRSGQIHRGWLQQID